MPKIIINSIAQLKALNSKLKNLSVMIPTLQKSALEDAAHETVLDDIHNEMRQNNFSEKIIDATFVGPIQSQQKKATIHFISDYVSDDGFDVSNAREEGTVDHIVRPKKPGGVLRWTSKTGEITYRKFARVTGLKRLLIIEKNINNNQQSFKAIYDDNIVSSINQVLR